MATSCKFVQNIQDERLYTIKKYLHQIQCMGIPHVLKRAICTTSWTDNHLKAIMFVFTAVLMFVFTAVQKFDRNIQDKRFTLLFVENYISFNYSTPHDWKRAICTSSLTDNHLEESKQIGPFRC